MAPHTDADGSRRCLHTTTAATVTTEARGLMRPDKHGERVLGRRFLPSCSNCLSDKARPCFLTRAGGLPLPSVSHAATLTGDAGIAAFSMQLLGGTWGGAQSFHGRLQSQSPHPFSDPNFWVQRPPYHPPHWGFLPAPFPPSNKA